LNDYALARRELMNKIAALVLGMAVVAFVAAPAFPAAYHEDDLQTIKKAVKENPGAQPGKEAKWFKILVVDNVTRNESVKVTVPLSLIEIFLRCADNKHIRTERGECDIDLAAVFKELKAAGPMAIIELNEDNQTIKVWLE
jgi:hypothetical protein